jgi:hypothetical protein
MKYLIILSALFLTACDGTKDIEEFDKRVEYCSQHGATYKTATNNLKEVFVYCLKDGREFKSKIFENED